MKKPELPPRGRLLAWTEHRGVGPAGRTEAEITEVQFSALSEHEIAIYVETGEPMDKAGAYAIQGVASRWVERIDGCYFNVVGLPVARVYRMLRALEAATGLQLA